MHVLALAPSSSGWGLVGVVSMGCRLNHSNVGVDASTNDFNMNVFIVLAIAVVAQAMAVLLWHRQFVHFNCIIKTV